MQLVNLKIDNIDNLKENYSLESLQLFSLDERNSLLIYVIKLNNFEDTWEQINFSLTQYIENYLNDNNKWNMYLIFITEKNISKELQYKIENDTLAFRKIIKDNYKNDLTEENIKTLISEYITFSDLEIKYMIPESEKYTSDSEVFLKLEGIHTLSDIERESILKSLEKDKYEI